MTGNLAVTAGWLAFDSADVALAKHMYSEALLLAEGTHDPILKARVLGQSSMLSSYLAQQTSATGLARHGLRLAEKAASVAAHEPMPRLHALIALRRADAAALLGDQHTFRASIGRARDELNQGASADDPAWIQFVDEFEIDGMEAIGHSELGHYSKAVELDRVSLAGLGGAARNRTCTHARLAATLALEGDTSSALDEARAVLAVLADGVKSPRTLNKLRPVRAVAQQVKDEDFCARFDSVSEALTG